MLHFPVKSGLFYHSVSTLHAKINHYNLSYFIRHGKSMSVPWAAQFHIHIMGAKVINIS